MCPAKGRETFPVTGDGGASGGKVSYSAINDYGGFVEGEAPVGLKTDSSRIADGCAAIDFLPNLPTHPDALSGCRRSSGS